MTPEKQNITSEIKVLDIPSGLTTEDLEKFIQDWIDLYPEDESLVKVTPLNETLTKENK